MADYDPYGGGDYSEPRPRPAQEAPDYTAPAVTTSQTPQAPTTQQTSPQTEQQPSSSIQATTPSPYQMGADFRYNTGGAANTSLGQYTGNLEGFEANKLNDPTKTTAKYMFGRVASKYQPTQQGFAQLVQDPEFQRLGMQSLGNGKIRLPNGDVIDVVRGFQSGGQAWQWGAETVNGQSTDVGTPQPYWQQQGYDPWMQYQQQMQQYQQAQWQQQQQWQQYMQQQQLYQAQQAMQQYYQQPAPQQPAAPTPYVPPTGGFNPGGMYSGGYGATPDYGGYGYNQGVGVYGAQSGANVIDPVVLSMQQLGQGLPMPYGYGG